MKNRSIYLIVIISLAACFQVEAQLQWFAPLKELDNAKLMVTYRLTYHEDTTDFQRTGTEKMVLLIGNTISNFQSYRKYECERIGRQKQNEGLLLQWVQSGAVKDYACKYQYSIYKNYPDGEMTITDQLFLGDLYEYKEKLYPFEWEILDDMAYIEGYLCQKAICNFGGRTWKAWFTNELPFNDGPYKFGGLPGLIMNMSDTQDHYRFEFLSIETLPEQTVIGWEEKDFIKTTKQDFFNATHALSNTLEFDDRLDDDMAKRVHTALKSRNNPIELK